MSILYTDPDGLGDPLLEESQEEFDNSSVFLVTKQQLVNLFEYDNVQYYEKQYMPTLKVSRSLEALRKLGGVEALTRKLKSDPASGINGDIKDMERRRKQFGSNIRNLPIIRSALRRFQDMLLRLYVITMIALCGSLIGAMIYNFGWEGLKRRKEFYNISISCVSIISFNILNSALMAGSLYLKDRSFQLLVAESWKSNVTLLRGRDQYSINLPSDQVVVGDVILLQKGQRVPADCIIIQEKELSTDESMIGPLKRPVKKLAFKDNFKFNPNPFLFASTLVLTGNCKALVCAVGPSTYVGEKKEYMNFEQDPSPTQLRMSNIKVTMQTYGILAAALVMSCILFFELAYIYTVHTSEYLGLRSITEILYGVITAVALVQCVLPECLDLIVTYSLVMQIRMKVNMLNNVGASEKLGGAQELLFSKSAVVTEHDKSSKVTSFYLNEQFIDCEGNRSALQKLPDSKGKDILIQSILYNTMEGGLQLGDSEHYNLMGNFVDCCLQWFLLENGCEVHYEQKKLDKESIFFKIGVNTKRMRSTVAAKVLGEQAGIPIVRVFTKGAPENILKLCPKKLNRLGEIEELLEKERQLIMHDYGIDKMAKVHSKPIAVAYRDIPIEQYLKIQTLKKLHMLNDDDKAELFENNFVFLCLLGIQDKPRMEAARFIQECKEGGVNVRMVTSENMFCARANAIELGLITKEESLEEFVCLEGKDFIKYVGALKTIVDEFGDVVSEEVPKKIAFQTVTSKLKVLARCTPTEKYALVCGLMDDSLVAVTGKSNEDLSVMKKADVGICLCSRLENDSIKDASDIIMVNDSLEKIVHSLKWGRALYANARKYLQFSITINIILIVIMVLGNFRGDPQLMPVHILWINIVIDNLMSIAFATDEPTEAVIKIQKPLKRDENVMTPFMAKNIFILSLYQSLVLIIMIFAGPTFFGLQYERYSKAFERDGTPTNKTIHNTMIFTLVVYTTITTSLVCRMIHDEETDFRGLFKNRLFNSFVVSVVILHLILIQVGGMMFDVTPLKFAYHLLCFALASSTFVVAWLAKKVSNEKFKRFKFTEKVEEIDINREEYNRMMAIYNSQALKDELFLEQQKWFMERTHSKRSTIKKTTYQRKKSSSFGSDNELIIPDKNNGDTTPEGNKELYGGVDAAAVYYNKLMKKFKHKLY